MLQSIFDFFSDVVRSPIMTSLEIRIPRGSLVLVTGATGHVAAHVVKILLEHGYYTKSGEQLGTLDLRHG